MITDTPPPLDPHAPDLPGHAVIAQRWSKAMFLHWRVAPDLIRPLLPPGIEPDVFDGSAWIALVPFVLSDFRFLPFGPVPRLGTFHEINIRTYGIDRDGRRGVVFQTLEAQHLVPVLTARALFGLPYRWAQIGMRDEPEARVREVRSRRRSPSGRPGSPRTRIRVAIGETPVDTPLSRFLTARWGFHERHLGRTIWAANEHEPWPLVDAELLALDDDLLAAAGFPDLAARPPDSVLAMPFDHPGLITRFAAAHRV
ncbi:MAG: hypothetical protein CMH34_05700 [Microbacterium sp.]|nr:hypothetical protein [Microbacterium sp.]